MRKPARRKCAHCREWFHPAREGQVVCSFECASAIGKKQTAKAREAAKARNEYARQLYANFYIPSFHDQEAAK
ncbi:TPA: hypothetical protein MH627_07985 [Klebsiella pneumoniae]|nr:hypothetical protein [Klebsiella pneumoniae]